MLFSMGLMDNFPLGMLEMIIQVEEHYGIQWIGHEPGQFSAAF